MNAFGQPISRRALLRGAGALVALPFLESLQWARGVDPKVKPPLRMSIVTVTGGTVLESWKPKEVGAMTKLPSILRPLEFARDQVTVISGLAHNGHTENLNGHEACAYLHLTGAALAKKDKGKKVAAISVDQAVAQAIGENTILPSLELGLTNQETNYSFRSTEQPIPYENNPRLVFERMFRGRKPVVPNWSRRAAAGAHAVQKTARDDSPELSVIDLILDDSKSVRGKLGKNDKEKLDEYLHSVRAVEKRIEFFEAKRREEMLDLTNPGPSKLNVPPLPDNNGFNKLYQGLHYDPEKQGEYVRLMTDLLVLAFQTDTTRVATMAVGGDDFMFPGVVTVGYERHCHTLEHQGNAGRVEDADPIAREGLRQIHAWYTELFADFVRKLQAIDEGGSTLFDNSVILYTSYMADGGHGKHDYPVLLTGKAGGALKGGRHIVCKKNTPVSNAYVEMLNLMGVKADQFGESATSRFQQYDGRIPGLV